MPYMVFKYQLCHLPEKLPWNFKVNLQMHVDRLLIAFLVILSNLRFCMLQPTSIFFFFPLSSTFYFWNSLKKQGSPIFCFFIMKKIKLSFFFFFFYFTRSTFLKTQLEIILWQREIDTVAFPLSRIDTQFSQFSCSVMSDSL